MHLHCSRKLSLSSRTQSSLEIFPPFPAHLSTRAQPKKHIFILCTLAQKTLVLENSQNHLMSHRHQNPTK
ncbi:hypothetical protein PGT21_022195 [Puccinia graminis f. sp. tritici]|uniref:Uncharacterized protein n=1 Tax=Puccinia graminis f. sp. tritici TaxID=56615 RepID=A0A5B0NV38_PUCGR|nr:hypothetical protein PGT21_022195 [Puccinia graminis f. sp. tritici]